MRVCALARDRVDALDVLRAEVVEDLVDEPDALVLAHPRLHGDVQLLVGGIDHRAGGVEQRALVLRLDHPALLHEVLAVDHLHAAPLEREQHLRLDHVDAQRLPQQVVRAELGHDLVGDVVRAAGAGRHDAAHGRDAGVRAPLEPRVVELVVAGRGAEVPQDRLLAADQQREARELSIAHVPMCVAVT